MESLTLLDRLWLSVALSSPYASRVPTFNTSPSQLSGGIHPNARTLNIAPEFWIFIKFERDCRCRTSIYTYGRYARNLVFLVFLPFPSSFLPMTADGKHGLHCHQYFLHFRNTVYINYSPNFGDKAVTFTFIPRPSTVCP